MRKADAPSVACAVVTLTAAAPSCARTASSDSEYRDAAALYALRVI